MASFNSTVEIERDPKTVWNRLTDYSGWAAWFSVMGQRLERSNLLVDKRGKGDVVRCFLDVNNYADFEVIHGENKLAVRLMRVQSKLNQNVQAFMTFSLLSAGKKTTVENTVEIQLNGMLGMAQPFLSLKGKSIQLQNLENFRRFVESQ